MPKVRNPWLASRDHPVQPRLRLFCFPFAGGTAAIFNGWQAQLPPDVQVCPLNLPGRGSRLQEPPLRRMEDLLEGVTAGIGPLLDAPYALFGHSLGALIAYELACHLRREERPQPVHFFASAARGVQLPDPYPPIHHLPQDNFIEQIQIRYGGIPAEVLDEPDLLQLLIPPLQADLELFETYTFKVGPPLACPITVFGGEQDHRLGSQQYEAWRELTTGPLERVMFPGGHFFIQERGPEVARAVARALAAV